VVELATKCRNNKKCIYYDKELFFSKINPIRVGGGGPLSPAIALKLSDNY